MQLNFTGKNIELTDALKDAATKKFQHIAEHLPKIEHAHITFKVEREEQIAEITLHALGADFHAHAREDDMYKAIDLLVDKVKAQLKKHKEKLGDNHR